MDKVTETKENSRSLKHAGSTITWCNGANDWNDSSDQEKYNEENGNVIKSNENDNNRISDEDEETNSMEDSILGLGNINIDDKNANCGAQGGGAVSIHSQNAFAEIEGDESELVTIETPIAPQRDLVALLKQTSAIPYDMTNSTLKSFFISVDEEKLPSGIGDHVRELLQDYQNMDENVKISPDSPGVASGGEIVGVGSGSGVGEQEQYEKEIPAHGDVIFHNFLVKIQGNPGQILRQVFHCVFIQVDILIFIIFFY